MSAVVQLGSCCCFSSQSPRRLRVCAEKPNSDSLSVQAQDQGPPSSMKKPKGSLPTSSSCVYCLLSADLRKTYVGVTSDIRRRVRQHNGELMGGAKAARAGRPWKVVCTVEGFTTYSQACQFEWSWKNISKKTSPKSRLNGELSAEEALLVEDCPMVAKRRAALERVKSSKDWPCLDIKWYLGHENF